MSLHTDVVIVGAGVVGSALARELSKYEIDVILIDKNRDVGGYASKCNGGTLSAGHDAPNGTLEAELTVQANKLYPKILDELEVEHIHRGTICVALNDDELARLDQIRKAAIRNGVIDVEPLSREKCLELEPMLNENLRGGLLIPGEISVDVFELVYAYIQSAMQNGVRYMRETEAKGVIIDQEQNRVVGIQTSKGAINAKFVINCAAIYADRLARTAGITDYRNYPRTGQYYVMDKNLPYCPNHMIIPMPSPISRGRLITPTVHGNILVGPSADNGFDRENRETDKETLESIMADCRKMIPALNAKDSIRQFTGVRPAKSPKDWFVRAFDHVYGYVEAVGISQGVSAAPAVAVRVREILDDQGLPMKRKDNFISGRPSFKRFADMDQDERNSLIKKDSRYGNVICRCETVTEGEIVRTIHEEPGTWSVDAVKRRLRAGMGRCQGGFCSPRVVEILARELDVSAESICKNEPGSEILADMERKYVMGAE